MFLFKTFLGTTKFEGHKKIGGPLQPNAPVTTGLLADAKSCLQRVSRHILRPGKCVGPISCKVLRRLLDKT